MLKLLMVAFALTACNADCPRPEGLWLQRLAERPGGTCGPLADELAPLGPGPSDSACGGADYVWSNDSCELESALKNCIVERNTAQQTTHVQHVTDGYWAGSLTLRVAGPDGQTCSSEYDLTAVKETSGTATGE